MVPIQIIAIGETSVNSFYYNQLDQYGKIIYDAIKNNNSKLFIIIKNKDYQIEMNRIMRENLDILFADLNYFKNYQKKLKLGNLLLLDYRNDYNDILKYLY